MTSQHHQIKPIGDSPILNETGKVDMGVPGNNGKSILPGHEKYDGWKPTKKCPIKVKDITTVDTIFGTKISPLKVKTVRTVNNK